MENTLQKSIHHIRRSPVILLAQVVFAVFLINTLYTLILAILFNINPSTILFSFTYFQLAFPFVWVLHTFQFTLLTVILTSIILKWTRTSYYISAHQLIYNEGVIILDETIYDLSHLRTVKVHQNALGKFFNYGALTLILAVSGYHETVTLRAISNPKKYERIFRENIAKPE